MHLVMATVFIPGQVDPAYVLCMLGIREKNIK